MTKAGRLGGWDERRLESLDAGKLGGLNVEKIRSCEAENLRR